jgi:hypothetical protein
MGLQIRKVESKADRKVFVKVPWTVFQSDPRWIPPLIMDRLEAIDERKNPFFRHGEAALFIAEKHGEAVGRISAHVNSLYNEYHQDKTGFFGWYDVINDPGVSRGLLETAEGWLKDKGCDKVVGPQSFSTNEEVGVLVKGFDKPLMIMCAYNPPYYDELIRASGYEKEKDLYGWIYKVGEVPEAPRQIADAVEQHPGLKVRTVDAKNMKRDVGIVRDIFNAAWNKNWGYVPWTDEEVEHSAQMMKMILMPDITAIAEVDGKPAGMMLAFPNILEIQKDLNGRLFPLGLAKLIYRLKLGGHKFRGARLFLLGIKPEFRGSVLGGLSVLLYVRAHRGGLKNGLEGGELGWTLEDNQKINAGIEFMGGRNDKVYRIYGKYL